MKIKKNFENMENIEKELDYLRKHYVVIGFIGDEANKVVEEVPVYLYALYNEYGTSRIPSRPFFRTALERNDKEIKSRIKAEGGSVATGQKTGEQALKSLGLYVQGLIQKSIKSGGWASNSPKTIKIKGKNNPLIDTGSMIKGVTFEIRSK